jgi:CubicO group peptidase (beta-lactamase class C family)
VKITKLRRSAISAVVLSILLFGRGRPATVAADGDPYALIRQEIEREIAAGHGTGVAVALTQKGKIIWEEGFGWADKEQKKPVTPDTPFSLASVTKSFTTTALMTMVAAGKVSLDAPANDYLGQARIRGDNGDPARVTVRALASHSAGLPGTFMIYPVDGTEKQPSMDEVIRDYAFLVTPPDTHFQYSNVGMGIVAHIIARESGREFGVYLHDRVLAPLGLSHSFFDTDASRRDEMAQRYDDTGNAFPFYVTSTPGTGELYASVHDVARFAMFHLKDHLARQKAILTDDQIDELHRPVIHILEDRSYGLGWMIGRAYDGSTVIYHNGNQPGVATVMMLLPSRDIACVVLTNQDSNGELLERVRDAAIRTLLPEWTWKTLTPPPPQSLPGSYQGKWHGALQAARKTIPLTLLIGPKQSTLQIREQKPEPVGDLGLTDGMLVGRTHARLGLPINSSRESDLSLRFDQREKTLAGEIDLRIPIPHSQTPASIPFQVQLSR